MADINFPPLGQGIPVYSASHKTNGLVVATMDNLSYPDSDYDWNAIYGVFPDFNSPIPAPYAGHRGTDIAVGRGTPLYCVVPGKVIDTGGTYNWVIIEAEDGYTYRYLHCDSVSVSIGQQCTTDTQIGTEGGTGASGANTYSPHLHLDRYETASGKVVDAFNVAIGEGSGGKSDVYMIVESIDNWSSPEGKIGLWIGGAVQIKRGVSIFTNPSGTALQMTTSNNKKINSTAWQGSMGENLYTIPANLVGDKVQVSVYDQLGALHPHAWIKISDINW